jgi:hypothetical protein
VSASGPCDARSGGKSHVAVSTSDRSSPRADENNCRHVFRLQSHDPIEAAPSIGPKSAERFERCGIATIQQFLAESPENVAKKLNNRRFSAAVVREYQRQAEWMLRVPNLRVLDAQLLVACGFQRPEDIAGLSPQGLLDRIAPYCDTKEGQRMLRGAAKPDLALVKNWVEWCSHTRALQAA